MVRVYYWDRRKEVGEVSSDFRTVVMAESFARKIESFSWSKDVWVDYPRGYQGVKYYERKKVELSVVE